MDHDWVIAFNVEDADLEQRPVCCWSDEHRQVVIEKYSSHRIANGMPYIRVGDPVLSRWLADPHLDNIACLSDDIVDHARQRLPAIPSSAAVRAGGSIDNPALDVELQINARGAWHTIGTAVVGSSAAAVRYTVPGRLRHLRATLRALAHGPGYASASSGHLKVRTL